jgi:hypothetical protein
MERANNATSLRFSGILIDLNRIALSSGYFFPGIYVDLSSPI